MQWSRNNNPWVRAILFPKSCLHAKLFPKQKQLKPRHKISVMGAKSLFYYPKTKLYIKCLSSAQKWLATFYPWKWNFRGGNNGIGEPSLSSSWLLLNFFLLLFVVQSFRPVVFRHFSRFQLLAFQYSLVKALLFIIQLIRILDLILHKK